MPQLRGESGTTLPLVALATIVLFGFVALAVDIGYGYGERRRSQSAADSSVLAAALEAGIVTSDLQDLADQAVALANRNLPVALSTADWENDAICLDTDPANRPGFISIAEFNAALDPDVVPDTHCISIRATGDEMRVTLPTRRVDTFFAGVIGVHDMAINSFAHAGLHLAGIGNPPPFVVVDGTRGGSEICLRVKAGGALLPPTWQGNAPGTDPTPDGPADRCEPGVYLTSTELRGTLDPYAYVTCTQPGSSEIDRMIADGIDHPVGTDWNAATPNPRVDGDGCKDAPIFKPNTMDMQTGTTAQILKRGLLTGVTSGPQANRFTGRLQKGSFVSATKFAGENMDNEPLWAFLLNPSTVPGQKPSVCQDVYDAYNAAGGPDPDWDYYDYKEGIQTCIRLWKDNGHSAVLFADKIVTSSRFAFLPQLEEETLELPGGQLRIVHFINMVPVWIQKLYQEGTESNPENWDPFCFNSHPAQSGNGGWFMHEAGQDFNCGKSQQNVDAIGSIVIECGMLNPDKVCDPSLPGPGGSPQDPGGNPVISIELTR